MIKRPEDQGGSQRHRPLGRFSQNFLVDSRVTGRIVECFAPRPEDDVLEVGPGKGALTLELAGRVRRLTAIEIDPRLAVSLAKRVSDRPQVEVRHGDILKLEIAAVGPGPRPRLIANLPYAISSPFVLKLIAESAGIADATLLFQLEFAERLGAAVGTKAWSSLTVLVQSRFAVTALFDISPGAFKPRPTVHSRLLRLVPLAAPIAADAVLPRLKWLLRLAFSGRRKTLVNALAAGVALAKDELRAHLTTAGVDPQARAETLAPQDWVRLAEGPLGHAAVAATGTSTVDNSAIDSGDAAGD